VPPAALALTAFGWWIRGSDLDRASHFVRGFALVFAYGGAAQLVGMLAVALCGLGVGVAIWRGSRAACLGALIASAAMIGLVWVARSMAIGLEDPRFVHKSPYVRAATTFAIAVTCYAALLAIASGVAWFMERRPKLDRPRTPL
jgi:hypothetical protein